MKPFLQELAEQVYKENPQLDSLTIVFPNRRAALYFRKHLTALLTKPAFAPKLVTIEDFISEMSALKVPDKLELIHRLYKTYHKVIPALDAESFDQFYFWGDMLLRDFDEVDKYMVNASVLFRDLRNQKELDADFDYFTDEQKEFLKEFWSSFDENLTESKKKFLNVWNQLHELYESYRQDLKNEGIAYEGMLHREVAEQLTNNKIQLPKDAGQIIFVGFNALTKAEEIIISHTVDKAQGKVYWDGDEFYMNDERQEAGKFMKDYQKHPVLKNTFSAAFPANFRQPKSVKVYGTSQSVGQAKLMAQILEEEMKKGANPLETLVVLPDEKLLMPVLHGIAEGVDKFNVTMGFSLSNTPLYNLVELLVELQVGRRKDHFSHRHVLALLGHPYVMAADTISANAKRREILTHNWVFIPKEFLATGVPLHQLIFDVNVHVINYLRGIIQEIGGLDTVTGFDKEYALQFLKLLNRLEDVTKGISQKEEKEAAVFKSFLRLFRQLIRAQKIPFTGEPLGGLQIMGVLETRNIDFKNVFILSLNEGVFPSFGSKGSYIPFNIRKAYQLPTIEHQDAMYAYLFYRVLQRAENIFLFYNSETDILGQGETSRYLQQLLYESGLDIDKKVLHNPVQPRAIESITIVKDESVLEGLANLNSSVSRFRGISPSALNTYIECRLKFYFRHVARIKEPNEVEEDLDARVLGNLLHDVMENFYKNIYERKKNKEIDPGDFDKAESSVEQLIDKAFIDNYRLEPGKKVEYEGQRLIVREIVKRLALRIIDMDKAYAPFVMEAVELEGLLYATKINHAPGVATLNGKIDRVDRKGDIVRVIDYKSGKDKLEFESIASLFTRDYQSRNKAAFQTLLYALLYKTNTATGNYKIIPGLVNRLNLFENNFQFGLMLGKQLVQDVEPYLGEFESLLKELLEELYDPAVPFDQTTNTDACKLCPYNEICYR